MLIIDPRAGSQELIAPLQARGLDVVETHLEFGDVAFQGRGEQDTPVSVGVEVKKLPELMQSMRSNRLEGHQLLGMREAPPLYDFAYLLIEGTLQVQQNTIVERRFIRGRPSMEPMRGALPAAEFLKRLHVLQLRGGLTPIWSTDLAMTVLQLEMLYRTWTDKPLDAHDSHIAIHNPEPLMPVSQFRQTANTLPGLGLQRTIAAQRQFGSIRRMANATVAEWAELPIADKKGAVKKLGRPTAERIVTALTESHA